LWVLHCKQHEASLSMAMLKFVASKLVIQQVEHQDVRY
jgi:hypothetical protein